jgi:hypothetical protein
LNETEVAMEVVKALPAQERSYLIQVLEAKASANLVKIPDTWIEPFLMGLMLGKTNADSARDAGIDVKYAHIRRRVDQSFCQAWNEAATIGTELLEQEAERRAYHGVDEPVFFRGIECGHIRKYSDTLLMFLLKSRRPAVYRDNSDNKFGGSFQLNVNVVTVESHQQNDQCVPETTAVS